MHTNLVGLHKSVSPRLLVFGHGTTVWVTNIVIWDLIRHKQKSVETPPQEKKKTYHICLLAWRTRPANHYSCPTSSYILPSSGSSRWKILLFHTAVYHGVDKLLNLKLLLWLLSLGHGSLTKCVGQRLCQGRDHHMQNKSVNSRSRPSDPSSVQDL